MSSPNVMMAKERDSDSTNSTGGLSNSDSGHGSNEDTESRPSAMEHEISKYHFTFLISNVTRLFVQH